MWIGLIYRRWHLPGLLAALTVVLLAGRHATMRRVSAIRSWAGYGLAVCLRRHLSCP